MHSLIIRNQDQFNIPGAPVLSANAEIPAARVILAEMLRDPGRTEGEKNQIFDALLKDHGLKTESDLAAPSIIRVN